MEIANRYNNINSLTVNLEGGNMKTTMGNEIDFHRLVCDFVICLDFITWAPEGLD